MRILALQISLLGPQIHESDFLNRVDNSNFSKIKGNKENVKMKLFDTSSVAGDT